MQLGRRTAVHGQGMRLVKGTDMLSDVNIESLEGFATLAVLCTKYAEPTESIVGLLGELIAGGITKLVDSGDLYDTRQKLPHNFSQLLRIWVQGILDADADTEQATNAKTWMAELSQAVGASMKLQLLSARAHVNNIWFLGELLGDGSSKTFARQAHNHRPNTSMQQVYNTMSMSTASIAIAAAANGADVSVECVTEQGLQFVPHRAKDTPTGLCVRFWLCQPPPDLLQQLKYYKKNGVTEPDVYARSIIFGGHTEVAYIAAAAVEYTPRSGEHRVERLWKAALAKGSSLRWTVKQNAAVHPKLLFTFENPKTSLLAGEQVAELATRWVTVDATRRRHFTAIAHEIAHIVHEEFGYLNYIDGYVESHLAAMDLILIAMTIGSIQRLIRFPKNRSNDFALNPGVLTLRGHGDIIAPAGELGNLLPTALQEGVDTKQLLWVAAAVWGGASFDSQGHVVITDRVLGIAAPQCTVILDMIRDPFNFAKYGIARELMSIHYGAIPMLAREPISGYIIAQKSRQRSSGRVVVMDCRRDEYFSLYEERFPPHEQRMVFTFEPDLAGASLGNTFCGWYQGDLGLELDPKQVFDNVLLRRHGFPTSDTSEVEEAACRLSAVNLRPEMQGPKRHLGAISLMSQCPYRVENGVVIFDTGGDPAWLLACAGCAEAGKVIVQRGELATHMATNSETIVLL